MKYRAVIVGCGARAPAHLDTYVELEDAEVVACMAPGAERRDKIAREYGIKAYDDLEGMLEKERPDVVHLVTPAEGRLEQMELVSKFGVPVCTVEKPVALGVGDWREICRLADSSKTKFGISHQCRWNENFEGCRRVMSDAGKPLLIDGSCGLSLAHQGTHVINYMRSLAGEARVARVFANAAAWSDDPTHPGVRDVIAEVLFENGVRGVFSCGEGAPRCGEGDEPWMHVRIGGYFERGRCEWCEFGKWTAVSGGSVRSGDWGGLTQRAPATVKAQAAFHRSMIDWHEGGRECPTSLGESLHEWKVALAMIASARENRPVMLDGFEPKGDLMANG